MTKCGVKTMIKALRIKDFPDYYITDTGDVYSRQSSHNPTGRIKKIISVNCNSYRAITLCNNKTKTKKLVHRLVAEAFIPNPEKLSEVNHKNGIKTDNRVENLEWVTHADNIKHSYSVLGRKGAWFGKKDKLCPFSKIVQQIKNGKIIAEFYGTHEAERKTGIHRQAIGKVCLGKRKSAGNFQWKYK